MPNPKSCALLLNIFTAYNFYVDSFTTADSCQQCALHKSIEECH